MTTGRRPAVNDAISDFVPTPPPTPSATNSVASAAAASPDDSFASTRVRLAPERASSASNSTRYGSAPDPSLTAPSTILQATQASALHTPIKPHETEVRAPQRTDHATPNDSSGTTSSEQSKAIGVVTAVGAAGGLAQSMVDVGRLAVKYPEAYRAGRLGTALNLTLLMRTDNRIIDPTAPRVATPMSGGRSFTRIDELGMKTSVLVGAGMSAVQLGAGAAAINEASKQDGSPVEKYLQTTVGRSGVLNLAGGAFGLGVFAVAFRATPHVAGRGIMARVVEAGRHPLLSQPWVGMTLVGNTWAVIANEIGFMDSLNARNERPPTRVLGDAVRNTPGISHDIGRGFVIGGASALVGAHVVLAKTSGKPVGPGLAATGAGLVVLGAAHAMNKLDWMNRDERAAQPTASGMG